MHGLITRCMSWAGLDWTFYVVIESGCIFIMATGLGLLPLDKVESWYRACFQTGVTRGKNHVELRAVRHFCWIHLLRLSASSSDGWPRSTTGLCQTSTVFGRENWNKNHSQNTSVCSFSSRSLCLPLELCDPCGGLSCRSMNLVCFCMSRLFLAAHCAKTYVAQGIVDSSSLLF